MVKGTQLGKWGSWGSQPVGRQLAGPCTSRPGQPSTRLRRSDGSVRGLGLRCHITLPCKN